LPGPAIRRSVERIAEFPAMVKSAENIARSVIRPTRRGRETGSRAIRSDAGFIRSARAFTRSPDRRIFDRTIARSAGRG
jgi:hypothetical protein